LHRGASRYVAARTDDLLKFKSFEDAEARVVGYEPGKGKYAGMMGAVLVERPDGVRFKIGSGFTDAERRNPPPPGAWITYAYNGLTENGLPRFARFRRLRSEDGIERRRSCTGRPGRAQALDGKPLARPESSQRVSGARHRTSASRGEHETAAFLSDIVHFSGYTSHPRARGVGVAVERHGAAGEKI